MHRFPVTQGDVVANHNQHGERNPGRPDEPEPSWRPQDRPSEARRVGWRDQDARDDDGRDAGERSSRRGGAMYGTGYRWDAEPPRRSSERYGQGQSGYSAGRRGDDRSQQFQNRNDMMASAGSFEDRHHDDRPNLGLDDRFTGRGRSTYWQDRTGYEGRELDRYSIQGSYRGRDFEPERHELSRGRAGHRDERLGYPAGSYGPAYGGSATEDAARRDAGTDRHVHSGTGPHRGKGPVGYERSDERIRELVCESLAEDDQLDASRIEVAVQRGEVTLSGTVDDRRAKRDAEDCAYSVSGVRDVQNLLRVGSEPSRSNASGQPSVGRTETQSPAQDTKHRS
jgi:osmotically-inducible protein OsmY